MVDMHVAGLNYSLMCILLEINECNLPNACPENADCNDLIGRCEYVCKDGFQRQGSACNGKQ